MRNSWHRQAKGHYTKATFAFYKGRQVPVVLEVKASTRRSEWQGALTALLPPPLPHVDSADPFLRVLMHSGCYASRQQAQAALLRMLVQS